MRIFAIDPGNEKTAYVILDKKTNTIIEHGISENELFLDMLIDVPPCEVDIYSIEMIASYGMSVGKEVFETCLWIGRFIQKIVSKGYKYKLIYRKDVKMELCGTMKAKDTNIRQRLIDIYGKQGTKKQQGKTYGIKADEWSALAVAHVTK